MVEPTLRPNFEQEIKAEIQNRAPHFETFFDAPTVGAPDLAMPDYVEHQDGVTEIGKLSAEAVVREYEATAKDIESLGYALAERVRQSEAITRNTLAVTAELRELAAHYREEAKHLFDHIESCSLVVAEARKTCTELKGKIAVSLGTDRPKPKKK